MHQVALAVKPAISASLECLRCFVWTDDVGGSTQVGVVLITSQTKCREIRS